MEDRRVLSFTLPGNLADALQEEARETDRSKSAVIRQAIQHYLGTREMMRGLDPRVLSAMAQLVKSNPDVWTEFMRRMAANIEAKVESEKIADTQLELLSVPEEG